MIPALLIRAVPYLLVVALVVATHGTAYYFGAANTANEYELQISQQAEQHQQAIAAEMAERLTAEQSARDAEQRKQDEIERVRQDAHDQIKRAAIDAAAAIASADRLRESARRAASRCAATAGASASATAGGSPAASPGVVLADVLGRIDARAGELADFAERAAVAGAACERSYGAVR